MSPSSGQNAADATTGTKCSGVKKDGTPCKSPPLRGSNLCAFHTPGRAKRTGKKGSDAAARRAAREKAELEHAKLAAHDFITIESAALGISDLVDFGDYCKLKMGSASEQFQSAWGRITFDCLRLTDAAGIRYWVDYGDPLAPEGEIVPLPQLPIAEFDSDD